MSHLLIKAVCFFWTHFVERKSSTQSFKDTLELLGLKEFEIFFSPNLAANDDIPSMAVTSSIKDCFEGNPKVKMSSFPTLKHHTLKHLGLLSLLATLSLGCAGVGGPMGGGGIDGGSSSVSGNGVSASPFGGNFTGSGTNDQASDEAIGEDDFNDGFGNGAGSGQGGYGGGGTGSSGGAGGGYGGTGGGGSGGGAGGILGGGTGGGGGNQGGNSLPQSSIPPPMLKKKVNVYATDAEGNTPVIGSEGAVAGNSADGDHVVVITTDPIEEVVARVKQDRAHEMLASKAAAKAKSHASLGQRLLDKVMALLNRTGLMPEAAFAKNGNPRNHNFEADIGWNVGHGGNGKGKDKDKDSNKEDEDNDKEKGSEEDKASAAEAAASFMNEDGSGKTDLALEDVCDGHNTTCCDTIQQDGSFECYTRAIPANEALNNANPAPYYLYILNKNTMAYSKPESEPINNKLRWFRESPKDLKTNAAGAYSLTNDISVELEDIEGMPLRVFGDKELNYRKDVMQGAASLALNDQSLAFLNPQGEGRGVYLMNNAAGAAGPLKFTPPNLSPNDQLNLLKYDGKTFKFIAEPDLGNNAANNNPNQPHFKRLYSITDNQLSFINLSIPNGPTNGCNGFRQILGYNLDTPDTDSPFYAVIYKDNNEVTCSIIGSADFNDPNNPASFPRQISQQPMSISDIVIYKKHNNTPGKFIMLDPQNRKVVFGKLNAHSGNMPEENMMELTHQVAFNNSYTLNSLYVDSANNRAYILSHHPEQINIPKVDPETHAVVLDPQSGQALQEQVEIKVDLISVFDLQPNADAPAYIGDYNLRDASVSDKLVDVIAEQISSYKTENNTKYLVIGSKDLKGAVILPEAQLAGNLPDLTNLSVQAVNSPQSGAIPNDLGKFNPASSKPDLGIFNNKAGQKQGQAGNQNKIPQQVVEDMRKDPSKEIIHLDRVPALEGVQKGQPPKHQPVAPENRINPKQNQNNKINPTPDANRFNQKNVSQQNPAVDMNVLDGNEAMNGLVINQEELQIQALSPQQDFNGPQQQQPSQKALQPFNKAF